MRKLRWTIQFAVLAIANLGFIQVLKIGVPCPFFYCYACPAAAFACPIGLLQNYAILHQVPLYAIGVLGLFGLALGRFWCGWACPFGLVQDLVSLVRRGRSRDILHLPRVAWVKFAVLVLVIVLAWVALDTLFCKICPAGSLFGAIPQRFVATDFRFGTFFYVHLATLGAALVLFLLVRRFWCRYLCPMGAVLGLFNPVSILKVEVDSDKCSRCGVCLSVCPASIERPEDIERCTDCTRCGRCMESCPTDAIKITASLRR
ncbi:MAG: 4Fe-4S binding protein [Dehalococcoidia bacterium]|nr:4Fe-4S binding protein [Dehalococcoidia bacterium]